jgi:CRISPR-associated endonuclease/helicase Cas3
MHQLANAVIVFDEIQTLPVNCVHLFNNAINFLVEQCGSTAVLCTATQPLLHKVCAKLGAMRVTPQSELMPDVSRLFADLKRVEIRDRQKPGGWTDDEIAALAVAETQRVGSCLVIVNTKRSARSLYPLCAERIDATVFHLSTSMCPAHRKKILATIRKRLKDRRLTLCISTQLIEAGVDVDFGAVIRFTAGLDSIAQAAGRCNRHGHREVGLVHVLNPADERLERLPDILIGRDKALRVLQDYAEGHERYQNDLVGQKAMDWYFQNYFFARTKEMAYPVSAKKLGHDDTLLNLLSVNNAAKSDYEARMHRKPNIFLQQSFMTAAKEFKAIDAPTHGVIVPYGATGKMLIAELCGAHMVEKEFDLLRRSQQYTVNVFQWEAEKLQESGAMFQIQKDVKIFYLEKRYYRCDFGLVTEPVGSMEFLNA